MQVQRSIRKKRLFVKRFALAVVFLSAIAIAGWFARPWLRERWYDYRDARMRADVPPPVSLRGVSPRDDEAIPSVPDVIPDKRGEAERDPGSSIVDPGSPPDRAGVARDDNGAAVVVAAVNLKIPFVSQAPHRNWDMPYQEACEEASAIMASLYYQGDTREMVIGDAGDALLKKVIAWEEERFGYYKDTTVAETVIMLEEYFKLRARIVDDPTVEQIKEAVAAGKPVIVPAYGKILPNPYFKNGGPLYHMLVVKGYTETKFITNDPGTNTRGAEFTYKYDAFMNAIHDWNGGDVPTGAKRIIIVDGPAV